MTPPTFQELLTSQEARFTNEQLEAWAAFKDAKYPGIPGMTIVSQIAATLLAERKAREVEVGALKRTMFTVRVIAVDALFQPTFQRTALERISAELRAALEGPTP